MKLNGFVADCARKLGMKLVRNVRRAAGAAILAGGIMFAGEAKADVVDFEDFEGLTLVDFDLNYDIDTSSPDWWSDEANLQTLTGWTLYNDPGMQVATEEYFQGWHAMDMDRYVVVAGGQGRTSQGIVVGGGNTALVADPDEWDDTAGAGGSAQTFNSWITKTYDFTGYNNVDAAISFDYEFRAYDSQRFLAEVSFDGGTTWTPLLDVDSDNLAASAYDSASVTFNAGTDFTPTSNSMILRFGCLDADNDWWVSVDNVGVTTGDGFNEFDDFEGTENQGFEEGEIISIGDDTDWTNDITDWKIDNSGMRNMFVESGDFQSEGAYYGWTAMDADSWNAQAGQGRTNFQLIGPNNTCLVCDPDQHDDTAAFNIDDLDMDGDPPLEAGALNSRISRCYDLCDFDPQTVQVTYDWEFNAYGSQTMSVEVSFDGGATWALIQELDSEVEATSTIQINQAFSNSTTSGGGASPIGAIPSFGVTSMVLRFSCTEGGNDWWMGVDNVLVEADPGQGFVLGDANRDGVLDFGDIEPFVLALFDPEAYAAAYPGYDPVCVLDISGDGNLDFGDIEPFVDLLFGN